MTAGRALRHVARARNHRYQNRFDLDASCGPARLLGRLIDGMLAAKEPVRRPTKVRRGAEVAKAGTGAGDNVGLPWSNTTGPPAPTST